MVTVSFTDNLRRHVDIGTVRVDGDDVRTVLDAVFTIHPALRGYVLDDQGELRKHVKVFVDNVAVSRAEGLDAPVAPDGRLFVMQALSGG